MGLLGVNTVEVRGSYRGPGGGSMGSYGWVMEVYGKGDSGGEYMVL